MKITEGSDSEKTQREWREAAYGRNTGNLYEKCSAKFGKAL